MFSTLDSIGAKECKSDRSREDVSNEYFLTFGLDVAEKESSKVCLQVLRDSDS